MASPPQPLATAALALVALAVACLAPPSMALPASVAGAFRGRDARSHDVNELLDVLDSDPASLSGAQREEVHLLQNALDRELAVKGGIDKRGFQPWGGKKRAFQPWGGKRGGMEEEATGIYPGVEESVDKRDGDYENGDYLRNYHKKGFQPWGGKRGAAFSPWGGKRGMDSPIDGQDLYLDSLEAQDAAEKRAAFQPWGGKRAFQPWGGKRSAFSPWGGKRGAFSPWGGKRGFQPWGGRRR